MWVQYTLHSKKFNKNVFLIFVCIHFEVNGVHLNILWLQFVYGTQIYVIITFVFAVVFPCVYVCMCVSFCTVCVTFICINIKKYYL